MRRSLLLLAATIAALAAGGVWLAFARPGSPLLAYWLLVALGAGVAVAVTPALAGLDRRARWLVLIYAPIAFVALSTTQCAARRVASSTHLRYRGVHVTGADTLVIGVGDPRADIRLQAVNRVQTPWSLRAVRSRGLWRLEPIAGIEQLRATAHAGPSADGHSYDVAGAALLEPGTPGIAVLGPDGTPIDTLAFRDVRLASARGNSFELHAVTRDIDARYARLLSGGTALAGLDGARPHPDAYERFVRVQAIHNDEIVNGARLPWSRRLSTWLESALPFRRPTPARLLLSAAAPYRLSGGSVVGKSLAFRDSALVEVRNADAIWRFELRVWQHQPSAAPGLALIFLRNPRPLETPLPSGVSCRDGAACGAISLRRLPPPVAQVTLAAAGFDTSRFGLLGRVSENSRGFSVVLPTAIYSVPRDQKRLTAIPVTSLAAAQPAGTARGASPPSRFVLLSASGTFGDDAARIVIIGLALGLLLIGIHDRVVAAARSGPPVQVRHERTLALGIATLLALLLTRLILGARVAFFAPFAPRAIETAVGIWVAIALVALALLGWQHWVPPMLLGARATMAGRTNLASTTRLRSAAARVGRAAHAALVPNLAVSIALALLYATVPHAVMYGLAAGTAVVLAWVCIAWTAAFGGSYFETFERGPWSIVEQLPPDKLLAAGEPPPRGAVARSAAMALRRVPELPIIVACIAAELSHLWPKLALVVSLGVLVAGAITVHRRRRFAASLPTPDFVAVAAGIAIFCLVIVACKELSANGSMGAFVLVILVALGGVRIGRGVGSRFASLRVRSSGGRALDALLLVAPMLLLAPLLWIDMGLFLLVVVPVGAATLLAADWRVAGWWAVVPLTAFALLFWTGERVLFPALEPIRLAESHAAQAAAFDDLSRVFGFRPPRFLATPLDRAASRAIASRDQELAERVLVAASPGPARELLMPSIEQVWGARMYAQAGWFGEGLGQVVVGGRGVAEPVSYAENTFAVFVLGEHGTVGGLTVLSLYLLLVVVAVLLLSGDRGETPAAYRASRALFVVAALLVAGPAFYVALSNLGVVPITGQNMPFLGLNAWGDVALCAGVVGILITGAIRGAEEARR